MDRTLLLAATPLVALLLVAAAPRTALPPPGEIGRPATGSAAAAVDDGLAGLLELRGQQLTVLYPGDHLDRAALLQMRLDRLSRAYDSLTRAPLPWRFALVGRERWERLAPGRPWGWPIRLPGPLFLAAAGGDSALVAEATELLGGAPPDPGGDPLVATREEAGSLVVFDLLLDLETARAFAAAARLSGDEPWIAPLVTQLALRYAWEVGEPGTLLPRVALFDRIAAAHGGARAHRLADYRPGLDPLVDLWFEAQFLRGADVVWVERGRRGVSRLLDRWADVGQPIRRADLEERFAGLAAWEAASFAP